MELREYLTTTQLPKAQPTYVHGISYGDTSVERGTEFNASFPRTTSDLSKARNRI